MNQMFYGTYSLVPINYDLVELLKSSFCFEDLQCTITNPNNIHPTVWILIYRCVVCVAYNHVCICVRLSEPITLNFSILQLRKCNSRFNFFLLSRSILDTLANRNDIAVSISGLTPFAAHNSLSMIEFNISDSLPDSFL